MKMIAIAVVTEAGLLIARRASTWTVDERLGGRSPECVAVDLRRPAQVYCGTARTGLLRSRDSGRGRCRGPADPDTVIVSATDGPGTAYWPRSAKAYVYRKRGLKRWEQAMSGLPEAKGTTASRFATHAGEPGVIYAANNRGLFRSDDAGRSWKALDLPWPEPGLADGVEALAYLPE